MSINPSDRPIDSKNQPFQANLRWYVETDCRACLHLTMHVSDSKIGPFQCLRCIEEIERHNFAARVLRAMQDLKLLDDQGYPL